MSLQHRQATIRPRFTTTPGTPATTYRWRGTTSNGILNWNYATEGILHSSPATHNGIVYVGSADHNVYALNAATETKIWSYTTGDAVYSSPAVANGIVYIGNNDHNVYALNANTGKLVWSYTTGDGVDSTPTVANGIE